MLMELLRFLWGWIEWVAQFWDPLAFLVIMALGLRAIVRDRRAYNQRDNDREVVFTLVSLLKDGQSIVPTLRIRNIKETTILDAMGHSRTAVKALLKAARSTVPGKPVLRFANRFDACEITHEVTNELSTLSGVGFLAQEAAERLSEVPFIFAVTCEQEAAKPAGIVNVRVQMVLESHLLALLANGQHEAVADQTICCWNLAEPESDRYKTRNATFAEVVRAYREWRESLPGAEVLAIGRVQLVLPQIAGAFGR